MFNQGILESIAALSDVDRQDLLSRLREIYGVPAPAPLPAQQMGLALGDDEWSGAADFLIVFDGGSLGNPGAGYGSYAIFEGSQPGRVQRLEFPNPTTNNEAEYLTLLAALQAHADQLGPRAAATSLEVRGDSQLVIEQVLGHWKAKDERMHSLRDEVRSSLRGFGQWRLVQQRREDSVRVLGH